MLKLILLLLLTVTASFSLVASDYFKLKKEDVQFYFGHLLSQKDSEELSRFGGDELLWPLDPQFEESFKAYLKLNEISYKIVSRSEKGDMNLTRRVWGAVPNVAGIPDTVIQLIKWENGVNPFIKLERRNSPIVVRVWHYEIPKKYLTADVASYADPAILGAVVIQKNGQEFVRWPIHPEDKSYHEKLERELRLKKIPFTKENYFWGMLTASRSLFIIDPETKKSWSLKTGTDHTGGSWQHKPMHFDNVDESRYSSDFFHEPIEKGRYQFHYLELLYETIGFTFKSADQGFVIREYKGLIDGEHYYLPAFAAQHDEFGVSFANEHKDSTTTDVTSYWRKHLNIPLARATGEFVGYSGLSYDSAHTQQYLIELDTHKNPTGKIVFRDFGDTYILAPLFKGTPKEYLISRFPVGSVTYDLWVRFGVFKSIKYCRWMFSESEWKTIQENDAPRFHSETVKFEKKYPGIISAKQKVWRLEFFNEFEKVFSTISGIPEQRLKHNHSLGGTDDTYKTNVYYVTKKGIVPRKLNQYVGFGGIRKFWHPYVNIAGCFQGTEKTLDGSDECRFVLDDIREKMNQFWQDA